MSITMQAPNVQAEAAAITAKYVNADLTVTEGKLALDTHTDMASILAHIAGLAPTAGLLGRNSDDEKLVLSWVSGGAATLAEVCNAFATPVLAGEYNSEQYTSSRAGFYAVLDTLESSLLYKTYIVGEAVTIADIASVSVLKPLFVSLMSENTRDNYPCVTRWFTTMVNQPNVQAVVGPISLCEAELIPAALKAEMAAERERKAAERAAQSGASTKKKAPKAKNVLDMLPASTTGMSMDGTKRLFSNDTFAGAIDTFWKDFDAEGFSVYRGTYQYNAENKVYFMTCNLIGGFMQRLDPLRNYGYGALCVSGVEGENPPFSIETVWIFRGVDVPFEMTDCPDAEQYSFSKVDTTTPEGRATFAEIWDGATIDGKTVCERRFFK